MPATTVRLGAVVRCFKLLLLTKSPIRRSPFQQTARATSDASSTAPDGASGLAAATRTSSIRWDDEAPDLPDTNAQQGPYDAGSSRSQLTAAPSAQPKAETTQQARTFTQPGGNYQRSVSPQHEPQTAGKPNAAFSPYETDLTHGTDHDDTQPNSDDAQTVRLRVTRTNMSVVKLRNVEQPQHSFSQLQQIYGPPLDMLDTVYDVKHNEMMNFIAQQVPDVKAVKVPPSPKSTTAGQPRLYGERECCQRQCVQDRQDEFPSVQARSHDLPYKQCTNSIVLKVKTAET